MKKKILAGVAALAMAVITVFSSAGTVQAEEGNVTDKPTIDFEIEGVTEKRVFSDEDFQAISKELGWNYATNGLDVVSDNATISINWDNSNKTKDDIAFMAIGPRRFVRNEAGTLEFWEWESIARWYADTGSSDYLYADDIFQQGLDAERYDLSSLKSSSWAKCQDVIFFFQVRFKDNSYCETSFIFEGMGSEFKYQENVTDNNSGQTTETHVVDLTEDNKPISAETFAALLTENATKDVVIKSNNNVTFTFAKGTMQAVDGKESYDFSTTIDSSYKSDMPYYITQNNFVSQIHFNYSGKLPAQADIRFPVGTQYAGKTLYYSLMKEDNTFAEVQSVTVDVWGFITVKQNHCSSYVVTTEEPKVQEKPTDSNTDNTYQGSAADYTSDNTSGPATAFYVIDLTGSHQPVSLEYFATILTENITKDIVIQSNNNVTYTFAKGTMQAVDGRESYDFSTTIHTAYKSDMPSYITPDNFVSRIDYHYSGKLPAQASIRFPVGTKYAGKTLYYYLMNEDNTFAEVQSVTVDAWGFITVKQNHCASYVVTTEKPMPQDKPTDTDAGKAPISKASVAKVKDAVYTGKAVTPSVKVTYRAETLTENKDYKVSYQSNKKIGKATIIITGIGKYQGTKTVSFQIRPNTVASLKAKSASAGNVRASWKKTAGKISGYEVVYSTNKSLKKAKKKTVKNASVTLQSLKSQKTYYVKVRAYKSAGGKKIYGSYSKMVKVRVK